MGVSPPQGSANQTPHSHHITLGLGLPVLCNHFHTGSLSSWILFSQAGYNIARVCLLKHNGSEHSCPQIQGCFNLKPTFPLQGIQEFKPPLHLHPLLPVATHAPPCSQQTPFHSLFLRCTICLSTVMGRPLCARHLAKHRAQE